MGPKLSCHLRPSRLTIMQLNEFITKYNPIKPLAPSDAEVDDVKKIEGLEEYLMDFNSIKIYPIGHAYHAYLFIRTCEFGPIYKHIGFVATRRPIQPEDESKIYIDINESKIELVERT